MDKQNRKAEHTNSEESTGNGRQRNIKTEMKDIAGRHDLIFSGTGMPYDKWEYSH